MGAMSPVFASTARILAASKSVLCSAMMMNEANALPASMVMLALSRKAKQGGWQSPTVLLEQKKCPVQTRRCTT